MKLDGKNPTYPLRLRRIQHLADARLLGRQCSSGWRWAAFTRSRTCAAAASTAKSGTRPAPSCRKQNVFDDFIAAAEWLIDNKYTSTPKLAIRRRQQRRTARRRVPHAASGSFRRSFAGVGVMDMLRFHKFTIGWAWTSDYGIVRRSRRVQSALRLFAAAQSQARHEISRRR